ncbi:DUF7094 domain-containing protein [Halogeometricum limi]|uniref:Uncharacterized protein n=1 Tax=Halogeometricum limi TaxID=555875 RepID=A0A1I6FWZ2_9EURY|nr:hypothetical protein [Halogeometricum limi]SFR34459.1 hypothetical protein SAMN04488124_0463 [Halogeometricum limi]
MRALPAMVVVVLVFSSVVGAVAPGTASPAGDAGPSLAPAASPPSSDVVVTNQTAQNATLHILGITQAETTQSSLETRHVSLGPALAFDENETDARVETLATLDRIESAQTTDRRQQIILQELSEIEQRAISLRTRQQAAIRAYGAGRIDARTFLVQLATIDIDARALEERRQLIRESAGSMDDFTVDSRSATLERELDTFTGPVRQHAADVLRGADDPSRFFLQTGSNSVVISTIHDDTYVREAYLGDRRARGSGRITLDEAANITAEAYPSIFALQTSQDGVNVVGTLSGDNSYLVRVQHRRGQLVSFVDSGSQRVFKEFQYRPLDTMQTAPEQSAVKDGLELSAAQTYPGGPVRIRLNDSQTGAPTDARITVGPRGGRSVVVGETGSDGSLWTMAPGQAYQVTAIRGNSVVVLTVQPSDPPLVNETASENSSLVTSTPIQS